MIAACPHCGRNHAGTASLSRGGHILAAEKAIMADPHHTRPHDESAAAARPVERLPESKPLPLEWLFPATLVGALGAIIGMTLPGQPWQPGALIGFFLVILPMKK